MLVVNNLRDLPGDAAAGKRTLAVRVGDGRTRALYAALGETGRMQLLYGVLLTVGLAASAASGG